MRPENLDRAARRRFLLAAVASIATLLIGLLVYSSAVATASLRFGYCGPSSLDHAQAACRVGTKLLFLSYVLFVVALVLAAVAMWLRRSINKRKSSTKPR
ncbi:hypothetical protein [Noviluteimonas dokdonensis]|uniref:hypothetical protein n=1 Tax=Noviluteimonas dokdonensis TaxID=414050 RepID=UPI00126A3FF7|nr:hypothetical protein [Lysobacter dokdonensis]